VINRSTAPSLGIPENQIKINAGDMRNTGIEFSIDGDVLNKESFSWNTGFNFTFSKNEIKDLPEGEDIFPGISGNPTVDGTIILREGESINSLYGHKYWGVNPENGSDRKSTRLNSSHVSISYAVFCLKK